MIGVIQRVLVDLVRERAGEGAATELLAAAGLPADFRFRIDHDYDDQQCLALFGVAGDRLQLAPAELFAAYAELFVRQSRVMFPAFYALAENSRDFLRRQPRIHNSFAAGLKDETARRTVNDKFSVTEEGDDLITTYRSANGLCALYHALALQVVAGYGDSVVITDELCTSRGDDHCRMRLHWIRLGGAGTVAQA